MWALTRDTTVSRSLKLWKTRLDPWLRNLVNGESTDDCSTLYFFFKGELGHCFTYRQSAPDISKYRHVEMFNSCTESSVKEQINHLQKLIRV